MPPKRKSSRIQDKTKTSRDREADSDTSRVTDVDEKVDKTTVDTVDVKSEHGIKTDKRKAEALDSLDNCVVENKKAKKLEMPSSEVELDEVKEAEESEEEEDKEEEEDPEDYYCDFSGESEGDTVKESSSQDIISLDDKGRKERYEAAVSEVSELLGVSRGSAQLLLRSAHWSKDDLFSAYMDNEEKVCRQAGVHSYSAGCSQEILSQIVPNFECSICRSVGEPQCPLRVTSLACGHKFCDTCWTTYLSLKIQEGETCVRCPSPSCHLRVPTEVVDSLCPAAIATRHLRFLLDSVVSESRRTAWCPVPNCALAVQATQHEGNFVTCAKGHSFCVECSHEAHAPADCATVKAWLKKCDDDSETCNWLNANTQECPKCHATIEKNGGCNHMTCYKCKHDFCWVCMGPWSEHQDFYNCNRYSADDSAKAQDGKAASRKALERYLFYFHRYNNHDQSRKLEAKLKDSAREKMERLWARASKCGGAGQNWGDTQYIGEATDGLARCRTVLKWTYVLAFSLPDDTPQKHLFCFLQQELERNTERLSELLESEVETLELAETRNEVLARTAVAENSRKKLLSGVEEGLQTE